MCRNIGNLLQVHLITYWLSEQYRWVEHRQWIIIIIIDCIAPLGRKFRGVYTHLESQEIFKTFSPLPGFSTSVKTKGKLSKNVKNRCSNEKVQWGYYPVILRWQISINTIIYIKVLQSILALLHHRKSVLYMRLKMSTGYETQKLHHQLVPLINRKHAKYHQHLVMHWNH